MVSPMIPGHSSTADSKVKQVVHTQTFVVPFPVCPAVVPPSPSPTNARRGRRAIRCTQTSISCFSRGVNSINQIPQQMSLRSSLTVVATTLSRLSTPPAVTSVHTHFPPTSGSNTRLHVWTTCRRSFLPPRLTSLRCHTTWPVPPSMTLVVRMTPLLLSQLAPEWATLKIPPMQEAFRRHGLGAAPASSDGTTPSAMPTNTTATTDRGWSRELSCSGPSTEQINFLSPSLHMLSMPNDRSNLGQSSTAVRYADKTTLYMYCSFVGKNFWMLKCSRQNPTWPLICVGRGPSAYWFCR